MTGKYDEGYLLIFVWALITLFLPFCLVYLQSQHFTSHTFISICVYLITLFIGSFVLQPLLWAWGKIGFISFYSYSLLIFIPAELLILFSIFKRSIPLVNSKTETSFTQARQLISKNKVGLALDILISNAYNQVIERELLLLKQQWLDFEKRRDLGMLTDESARATMAQIVNGILSIIGSETK